MDQPDNHAPARAPAGEPHAPGHAGRRWSALASDARGRLLRVGALVAVLWLAVGWALGVGAP
jgi:hypothetical protein